jgi:hypothetical protein
MNSEQPITNYKPRGLHNVPAFIISVLFHPLFVPLYIVGFLVYIHPSYFAGVSDHNKLSAVLIAALNAVFFPLITVLLLLALKFIDSIFLHSQKDRIIPYIASGIFFFWTFWVFYNNEQFPKLMASLFLGMLLASSTAVVANNFFKISMHAIGMGGWLAVFIVILKSNTMLMSWPLATVIILTGLVCTARLSTGSHTYKEIIYGLLLGMASQFVAAIFVH